MIDYMKNLMAYLFEITLIYYLLPLLLVNTGVSMLALFVIIPVILLVVSITYGMELKKMDFVFIILIGVLFIPIIMTYMNVTAYIYCFIYMIISLIGNLLGILISKNKKNKKLRVK